MPKIGLKAHFEPLMARFGGAQSRLTSGRAVSAAWQRGRGRTVLPVSDLYGRRSPRWAAAVRRIRMLNFTLSLSSRTRVGKVPATILLVMLCPLRTSLYAKGMTAGDIAAHRGGL